MSIRPDGPIGPSKDANHEGARIGIEIEPVRTKEQIEEAATLFTAYAASLGIDLSFQSFEEELKQLPGKYAPPTGEIFLARPSSTSSLANDGAKSATGADANAGTIAGQAPAIACVAFRPLNPAVPAARAGSYCEMKRLYVTPSGRGTGLGRRLVQMVITSAKSKGYKYMVLDTLPTMQGAVKLYREQGFVDVPPYYDTPLAGTIFLSLNLEKWEPK